MSWVNNKLYQLARKDFVSIFTNYNLDNLHYSLPKIVFICGGDEKYHSSRTLIEEYFIRKLPKYLTFRAENVWNIIQSRIKETNALELEEWLADFSDSVIILVESFGTAAELGAFSLNQKLRKKLLPILDYRYMKDPSFINTGPIKWINSESKYSPAIYVDYNEILLAMEDVENKLSRKTWEILYRAQTYGIYHYSNKVLLFMYVYILSALGPISIDEIISITEDVIMFKERKHINFIISVGVALGIFSLTTVNNIEYYSCIDYEKLFTSSLTKKHLNRIQNLRSRSLSNLLRIVEYKKVLTKVIENVR